MLLRLLTALCTAVLGTNVCTLSVQADGMRYCHSGNGGNGSSIVEAFFGITHRAVQVYGKQADSWDAVVTCFFVDCAK